MNIQLTFTKKRKLFASAFVIFYKFYSAYYHIGNGRINIDKSIEDILWIMDEENTMSTQNGIFFCLREEGNI